MTLADAPYSFGVRTFTVRTIVPALFLLGSIALYVNSIAGELMYDDTMFSLRPELRQMSHLDDLWLEPYAPDNPTGGIYRPLSIFTFALNFQWTGESPIWFHIVNIVLHGLVSFLFFLVARRLTRDERTALLAGVLFLFLPIHGEAVAAIKSRDELLAASFTFLSWLTFMQSRKRRRETPWLIVAAAFYVLALLSKELIALAPIVFILVWWWRGGRHEGLRALLSPIVAFAIALAAYCVLRFIAVGNAGFVTDELYFIINPLRDAPWLTRCSTALSLLWFAAVKTVVPWNLSATYHYNHLPLLMHPLESPYAILGLALLGTCIGALCVQRVRASTIGVGIVLFLVPYALFSKLLFAHGDMFAERWLYFVSAGPCLLLAIAWMEILKRSKPVAITILSLILLLYAGTTMQRSSIWNNLGTLGTDMIRTAPRSIQGYRTLAEYHLIRGETALAVSNLSKAIDIYPEHPPVLAMIAAVALEQGDIDVAAMAAQRAVELRPELASVLLLATVRTKQGNYNESLKLLEKHFSKRMELPAVRRLMAINLYRTGSRTAAFDFQWDPSLSREEMERAMQAF